MNKKNYKLLNECNSLTKTIIPLAQKNLEISNYYANKLINEKNKFIPVLDSIAKMVKEIHEMYEPFMKNATSTLTEIFKDLDWSQFDIVYKNIAIKFLLNGFYPYRDTNIQYSKLADTENLIEQLEIIKKGITKDVQNKKDELLHTYPHYKKELNEIYTLYSNKNFRLCILSTINLISIINNTQFTYIDFTENKKIGKELLKKQIMKEQETNYLIFSPYIEDSTLLKSNLLIINYKKTPEKYFEIPYNRNSIFHGYSDNFGTHDNCLRWFSVLFNTLEITKEIIELEKNYPSNQN